MNILKETDEVQKRKEVKGFKRKGRTLKNKRKHKKKKLAKLELAASKSPDIPSQVKPRVLCSKEEILEINEYVRTSEYFAVSKVKDMSHSLLRELIR